jgi:hypothetical protein
MGVQDDLYEDSDYSLVSNKASYLEYFAPIVIFLSIM